MWRPVEFLLIRKRKRRGGGVFNIPKERPASPSPDQYSWEAVAQPPKEWNEPEASNDGGLCKTKQHVDISHSCGN